VPRSWRTIPWHPVLLVVVVVLGFWMDAVVSPYATLRSLLIAMVAAGLATTLASLGLRNSHAGGLVVTALIGLMYTKHLVRLVTDLGPRMQPAVLVIWLLAMALAVVLAVRIALRSAGRMEWPGTTWFLNRMALILFVATIGAGILNGKLLGAVDNLEQGGDLLPAAAAGATEDPRPDIYVLLVDGYPRADVLDYAFDYDNSAFVGELQRRGFEIADESHSDYLWTHVSLTSLLHMAYIEQIGALRAVVEGKEPLYPALSDAVNHNPVFDAAEAEGYEIVSISGGFEQLAVRQTDVFLDGGQLNEFELKLLNSTYLGQVVSFLAPTLASGQHADRIRSTLDLLVEVAHSPRSAPRLVFAHVPSPHQPTVFRSDGSPLPVPIDDAFYLDSPLEKGVPVDRFIAEYRDHLTYLNGLLMESLDGVLEASTTPPIVVLVADHGSASHVDWTVTQPSDAEPADLLERTGTLFAALTPERQAVFPEDISPVSVFRYLFDAYFGTAYGPAVPPPGGGQVAPVDASVLR
jgi:hypothetical protein